MKKIIVVIGVLLFFTKINAQQDLSLYYQEWLPQSTISNPAIQNECKAYFGGLALPIVGQVLPNMHFNYSNNNWSYKDLVHSRDTMILIDNNSIETMLKNIRHVNYITMETHLPYLYGGYKINDKYYVTFGVTDKVDFKYSMPRDLLVLAWEGNGKQFLGNTIDFTGLGIDFTYYREYALGFSWKINDKWTVGIRPKMLFGKMNIYTCSSNITWETNADDYSYLIHSDVEVNISQPFYEITKFDYDYENDSLIYEDTVYDVNPKKMIFNNHNFGLGVDLGAIYKVNDKITLYASALDLGYIKWKTNPQTLKIKGDFLYDGYNVRPFLEENDSINDANADQFRDSVIHIFEPQYQKNTYTSYLTPKIYVGGTYQWKEFLNFGALARFEFYRYVLHPSLTLSANSRLTNWFGATMSYTIMNRSFLNIGLGLIFKIGPVQMFVASDNFWGFIWPQSTRNMNIRMGTNIRIGCKKYEGATLIH